jgi:hypothetical protein
MYLSFTPNDWFHGELNDWENKKNDSNGQIWDLNRE